MLHQKKRGRAVRVAVQYAQLRLGSESVEPGWGAKSQRVRVAALECMVVHGRSCMAGSWKSDSAACLVGGLGGYAASDHAYECECECGTAPQCVGVDRYEWARCARIHTYPHSAAPWAIGGMYVGKGGKGGTVGTVALCAYARGGAGCVQHAPLCVDYGTSTAVATCACMLQEVQV